jgi:hypothetical protein
MADNVREIHRWLDQFPPDWDLWIDEGGLTLVAASPNRQVTKTYELGGEPLEED